MVRHTFVNSTDFLTWFSKSFWKGIFSHFFFFKIMLISMTLQFWALGLSLDLPFAFDFQKLDYNSFVAWNNLSSLTYFVLNIYNLGSTDLQLKKDFGDNFTILLQLSTKGSLTIFNKFTGNNLGQGNSYIQFQIKFPWDEWQSRIDHFCYCFKALAPTPCTIINLDSALS